MQLRSATVSSGDAEALPKSFKRAADLKIAERSTLLGNEEGIRLGIVAKSGTFF
jgi:hypothetical protein